MTFRKLFYSSPFYLRNRPRFAALQQYIQYVRLQKIPPGVYGDIIWGEKFSIQQVRLSEFSIYYFFFVLSIKS